MVKNSVIKVKKHKKLAVGYSIIKITENYCLQGEKILRPTGRAGGKR